MAGIFDSWKNTSPIPFTQYESIYTVNINNRLKNITNNQEKKEKDKFERFLDVLGRTNYPTITPSEEQSPSSETEENYSIPEGEGWYTERQPKEGETFNKDGETYIWRKDEDNVLRAYPKDPKININSPSREDRFSRLNDLIEYKNMPLEELLKREGLNKQIKITSHIRSNEHNRQIGGAKRSHHLQETADQFGYLGAYDIVPNNISYEQLYNLLTNNPNVVSWMKVNGYNINDETNRKGYRPHFHLGRDRFNTTSNFSWSYQS